MNCEKPTTSSSSVPSVPSSFGIATQHPIEFTYTSGELPRVRQMWYCICDVKLPIAQEIVEKEFFAQGDRADDQNGWLPPKVIDSIRAAIKEDVKKVSNLLEEEEGYMVDEYDEDW